MQPQANFRSKDMHRLILKKMKAKKFMQILIKREQRWLYSHEIKDTFSQKLWQETKTPKFLLRNLLIIFLKITLYVTCDYYCTTF